MRQNTVLLLAITLILGGMTGCSNDEILPTSKYFVEAFPDLDVQTLSALETPYEDVFKPLAGGRITGVSLEEISTKLAEIFAGATVLEAEVETERGLAVWEIKLKMPSGGILEVSFVQELGEILKMEGKSGPFDYDVNPGGDFISLRTAIDAALAFRSGDVVKWELELEEDNRWEYEIHLESGMERFEIEIDAFTGALLAAKEKEEEDDHESEEHDVQISQDLENFVHGLLAGQIVHVDYETEDLAWDIYVKTAEGAIVEFRISDAPYSILRIEGEHGPYTYNIAPGNDLLTFAAAKEIALNHISGDLEEWELDKEGDIWVYEFKITNLDGHFEVKLNAVTGEIL